MLAARRLVRDLGDPLSSQPQVAFLPAAGGPPARVLGVAQRALDQQARLIISQELGHIRAQIVQVYCG